MFLAFGVEQENDKKAREKPKSTPISTRLKTKRFFDDNFCAKFIYTLPQIKLVFLALRQL
jgi:hypothetical protein